MLSLRIFAFGLLGLSCLAQVTPEGRTPKVELQPEAAQPLQRALSPQSTQLGKSSTISRTEGEKGSSPPSPARGTCLIYAAAQESGGTQLFTSSVVDRSSQVLGSLLHQIDIDGLAFHPRFDTLFALAGPGSKEPGTIYLAAKESGDIRTLGMTGFVHMRGLAFRDSDATLWSWDQDKGLIQIDVNTGQGKLNFAKHGLRLEALAWNPQGTVLFGASGHDLWVFDSVKRTLRKEDDALPSKAELFLMRADGNLLLAEIHGRPPQNLALFVYDIATKRVVNSFRLDDPFDKLEAIAWQDACGNPDPGGRVHLIRTISLDKTKVCQGDEVKVSVATVHPDGPPNTVDVFINQLAGAVQYLNFTGPAGTRRIAVQAWTPERYVDYGENTVEVLSCVQNPPRPLVRMGPDHFHTDSVDFIVANAKAFVPTAPMTFVPGQSYSWDFGDGNTSTTTVPFVTHDYTGSLPRDDRYGNFVASVSVRLVGPGGGASGDVLSTAHKSLALFNFYAFNRRMGIIRPPTQVGDAQLVDQLPDDSGSGYLGTFSLTNLEESPITLTNSQLERQYCNPEKASLRLASVAGNDVVGPTKTIQRLVVLGAAGTLTSDICGVAVHLSGNDSVGRRVMADLYYKIRDNPLMRVQVRNPQTLQALNQVSTLKRLPSDGAVTDEDIYQLSKQGLIVSPSGPAAGRTVRNMDPMSSIPAACGRPKSCSDLTEPTLGSSCDPSCATIRPGLVCAIGPGSGPGGTFTANDPWCQDPASIQNAEKGDSVMSPGCGTIGAMLHALPNPQHFSHVGIMTRDRYELADSTASEDLLSESGANDGLGGSSGWKPDLLRFAWPGSIEQTVDEAFVSGSQISNALFSKEYTEQPLSSDPEHCLGDTDLIFPRVARGSAEMRDVLHTVADAAKANTVGSGSQLGDVGKFHYRFFGYTKGDVASTTAFQPDGGTPPDDPGLLNTLYDAIGLTLSHVATRPSVCSSFIWQMLQDNAVPVAIREPDAFNQGVLASNGSPGLVFYSEADRLSAGSSLFNSIYNQVQGRCPPDPIPCFGAPGNHAAQAVNCMGFDQCEEVGFAHWLDWIGNIGDGSAVSPDNMLLWTVYPTNEPIVFRQGTFRRPYTWHAANGTGCITGQVLAAQQFAPTGVPGATVYIRGLQRTDGVDVSTISDGQGNFSFQAIPALTNGSYCLHAQVFTDNNACFDEADACQVIVQPKASCTSVPITLQPPPQILRTVAMTGTITAENSDQTNSGAINFICHVNLADPSTNLTAKLDDTAQGNLQVNDVTAYAQVNCHLNADLTVSLHVQVELDHCGGGLIAHGCPDAVYGPSTFDTTLQPGQTGQHPDIHLQNGDNSDWADFKSMQFSNDCAGCFGKETCTVQ